MKDAEKDTTVSLAELCLKHRKAGIKEVVETIGKYCYIWHDEDNTTRICLDTERWQAKLEEWGIE